MICNLNLPATLQAIMLVESVDGEHALLGRPRSLRRRGPVLTCLSGFIEQGESIEEAVSDLTRPSPAGIFTLGCLTAHPSPGIGSQASIRQSCDRVSSAAAALALMPVRPAAQKAWAGCNGLELCRWRGR